MATARARRWNFLIYKGEMKLPSASSEASVRSADAKAQPQFQPLFNPPPNTTAPHVPVGHRSGRPGVTCRVDTVGIVFWAEVGVGGVGVGGQT